MIGHNLNSQDFRIVFCWHPDFLVLAYIPMPEGRGFTLDLGNPSLYRHFAAPAPACYVHDAGRRRKRLRPPSEVTPSSADLFR